MGLAWALAVTPLWLTSLCLLPALLTSLQGSPQHNLCPKDAFGLGPAGCGYEGPGLPILWDFHHKLRAVASRLGLQLTVALN